MATVRTITCVPEDIKLKQSSVAISQLAAMENVTTVRWGTRPGKAAAKEG